MKKSRVATIVITIITVIFIPVILYTIFQFTERNKEEKLIKDIYDRQLNTILFSVNQYCWDLFNSWTAEIITICKSNLDNIYKSPEEISEKLDNFANDHKSIVAVFLESSGDQFFIANKKEGQIIHGNAGLQQIKLLLAEYKDQIHSHIKYAEEGYIKPVILPWPFFKNKSITLLTIPMCSITNKKDTFLLAGIFIDVQKFVNNYVSRKFREMDDGNLIFAVKNRNNSSIIFSTEREEHQKFERSISLWLLPQLDLLIKLKGTTLEKVSKSRAQTNLILLVLINLVLVLGIVYVLRNLVREMKLVKMKTDFVANVSHELRTPLALIRMYSETLEMNRVRDKNKKQKYYKIIMNESSRLTQLINNILDFSKIESKRKEYHFIPANISKIVDETLEMYSYQFEQKKFELEKKIEDNLPEVKLDRESVTQAIVNLLDNAIKFSKEKKKIKISLYKNKNSIVLSIEDYGIGIPDHEQKKIFEKFYRVENELSHNTKGSGLGLSLVKNIMDMHKGKITVSSKLTKGSKFSLIFPID
jgi:two-component system phosphate regulon sensor histidine kinase PhoR